MMISLGTQWRRDITKTISRWVSHTTDLVPNSYRILLFFLINISYWIVLLYLILLLLNFVLVSWILGNGMSFCICYDIISTRVSTKFSSPLWQIASMITATHFVKNY